MSDITLSEQLSLRLNHAHSLGVQKGFDAARADYAAIADDLDVPAQCRSLAQLCVAACCVRTKDYSGARAACEAVKTIEGRPRQHVAEAEERILEIARMENGLPARALTDSRVNRAKRPEAGLTLYVSVDGCDENPGTENSPFATLCRARDEIRTIRQGSGLPAGGVTVIVGDGEYRLDETFCLTEEDSGTCDAPIIYRASDGATPRFNAASRISGFEPVTDPVILARLPEESRGNVQQVILDGIDLGKFEPGGYASGRGFCTHPMLELYFDGEPMPISRWPSEGYVNIDDVLVYDGNESHGLIGSWQGLFSYTQDRPERWHAEKDIWLYGYWFWDWADSYEKVASIDLMKKQISLEPPFHNYGYRKGQRFCAVNLLCEIDSPGEWYLDRGAGILYFYPPADPSKALIEVSQMDASAVELDGASHVSFEGLLWEGGCGDAITIKGGDYCLLAGCTVRKFGGNGVVVDGGTGHGILSCDIHTLGRGGTVISGGDRETLTPGGHLVENCHIHHFSRIDHTYTPAVIMSGVGNRIAHNLFHDSSSSAMRVEGNDHLIEFNEIRNVLLESDDQGGADMFGDPTYRGNIFRYNYWHDMGNGLGCGQAGIRLDDAISGTLIYGNIFERCADGTFGGVQIHGGKDNYVENNLFLNCKAAVSFSPWGTDLWKSYLDRRSDNVTPLHIVRYQELATLYERNDVNHIWRNVTVNCGEFTLRDPGCNDLMDNSTLPEFSMPTVSLSGDRIFGEDSVLPVSFRPIPVAEIGMYIDEYRSELQQ